MSPAALARVGYGHRFFNFLQGDLSLDVALRAAGTDITQQSLIGNLQVHDNEYIVPFGVRFIVPLGHRLELFMGGGGAYLHYAEEAEVPEGISCAGACFISVECPSCRSRGGWGYHGTAGGNVSLDRRQRVWLGLETRLIRGRTSGEPVGSGPAFPTEDGWLNTTINISFRF